MAKVLIVSSEIPHLVADVAESCGRFPVSVRKSGSLGSAWPSCRERTYPEIDSKELRSIDRRCR